MQKYKCEIDGIEFSSKQKLGAHIRVKYKITPQQYYHKYIIKSDEIPKCGCGCNEICDWAEGIGYRKYKRYHHIRVKNPWGHNPEAIRKSAETRRQQYASGERKTWCDGLKKEETPSLQAAAEKLSARYTHEIRKQYSEKMAKMRNNGTIPTLYREKTSQWKGGVSSIQMIARNAKRLYSEWKYPILIRDGFKCIQCNDATELHVHHDKETFSEIIKKVMTLDDYEKIDDFNVKQSICEKVIDYHVTNTVSGITLCKKCHNKLHPSLNF
jgi:hypothetical protein